MSQDTINPGATADDGNGDSIFAAATAIGDNFNDLNQGVSGLRCYTAGQTVTATTETTINLNVAADWRSDITTSATQITIPSGWSTVAMDGFFSTSKSAGIAMRVSVKKSSVTPGAGDVTEEICATSPQSSGSFCWVDIGGEFDVSPGDLIEIDVLIEGTTGSCSVFHEFIFYRLRG